MLQLKIKASELTGLAYRELLGEQQSAEKASGGVRKVELVKRHYDAKESPVIYQMRTHKYEQKKRSGIRASSEHPRASQAQIQYSIITHKVNTKK